MACGTPRRQRHQKTAKSLAWVDFKSFVTKIYEESLTKLLSAAIDTVGEPVVIDEPNHYFLWYPSFFGTT